MNKDEIINLINRYFDSELDKNKEPLLFTILAENSEAREYFKHLNLLKASVEESAEQFPAELEERIFATIKNHNEKSSFFHFGKRLFIPVLSLAAVFLMLILTGFLFFEIREYKSRVEVITEQVRYQNRTIELILNNSLPPAEIESKSANEIIIKANL